MQRSLGLFHVTESYLRLLQEAPLRDHLLWQQGKEKKKKPFVNWRWIHKLTARSQPGHWCRNLECEFLFQELWRMEFDQEHTWEFITEQKEVKGQTGSQTKRNAFWPNMLGQAFRSGRTEVTAETASRKQRPEDGSGRDEKSRMNLGLVSLCPSDFSTHPSLFPLGLPERQSQLRKRHTWAQDRLLLHNSFLRT